MYNKLFFLKKIDLQLGGYKKFHWLEIFFKCSAITPLGTEVSDGKKYIQSCSNMTMKIMSSMTTLTLNMFIIFSFMFGKLFDSLTFVNVNSKNHSIGMFRISVKIWKC